MEVGLSMLLGCLCVAIYIVVGEVTNSLVVAVASVGVFVLLSQYRMARGNTADLRRSWARAAAASGPLWGMSLISLFVHESLAQVCGMFGTSALATVAAFAGTAWAANATRRYTD